MKRSSSHTSPEIRQMLTETQTCLCCGASLRHIDNKDARRNRGYCRRQCYYDKPPKLAYAERVWGMTGATLLVDLLSSSTVTATAELLGITKAHLYAWMRKLGVTREVAQ